MQTLHPNVAVVNPPPAWVSVDKPAPATCLRYTDECGWYAMLDGKVLDDGSGISGTWEQAWKRLFAKDPQQAAAGDHYQAMLSVPGWAESLPF